MQKTPTTLDNAQGDLRPLLFWGYLGMTFSLIGCGGRI